MKEDIWNDLTEMVEAGRLASGSAERSVMFSLMRAIKKIISIDKRVPDGNTRIWTIHRIENNRIFFHDSSFRKSNRSKYQNLEAGLIGRAIADGEPIRRFADATHRTGYVQGWNKTNSELICLIHDEHRMPVGVINIESEFFYDFFTKKNNEKDPGDFTEALRKLESVVVFAANLLSPIFRSRYHKIQSQRWEALSHQFERTKSDNFLNEILQKGVEILPNFLPVLVSGVYVSNFSNSRTTPLDSDYRLIARIPAPDAESPAVIPEEVTLYEEVDLDRASYYFSGDELSNIFGNNYASEILSNDGAGEVIIQKGSLESHRLDFGGRLILIVVLDRSAKSDKYDDYEKRVKEFFKLCLSFVRMYVLEEIQRHNDEIEKINTKILAIAKKNNELQSVMNEIADNILEATESRFCLIYLKGPTKADKLLQTFFAIGSSPSDTSFANKMIPMKSLLGKTVLENESYNYQSDFFECEWGNQEVISELKQYSLKKPEVFIQIFSRANEKGSLGAIVLIREAFNKPPSVGEFTVKRMLNTFSDHVGQVYENKIKSITNKSLSESYGTLFGLLPELIVGASEEEKVKSFFSLNNKIVSAALKPLSKSAYFVIYKRNDLKFLMHEALLDSRTIRPNPPTFEINKGITGSVMLHPGGEIFEPYVDRATYSSSPVSPIEDIDIIANPQSECQEYWDKMLGSPERFFFGRHVRINTQDYVLIVIGTRGNDFNPNIGQSILRELTNNIADQFNKIVSEECDEIKGKLESEIEIADKLARRDMEKPTKSQQQVINQLSGDLLKLEKAKTKKIDDALDLAQSILTKIEKAFSTTSSIYKLAKGLVDGILGT